MPKGDDGQYELILETRQVMVIFVLAVILGAVFFGLGFVVGRHSTGPTGTGTVTSASPSVSTDKRSALSPTQPTSSADSAPAETPVPEVKPESTPAAIEAKGDAPPVEKPAAAAPVEKAPPTPVEKQPEKPKPAPPPEPAAKRAETAAPAASNGPIVLQVSAHGHREDAEPVVALLKRKGFPASIVTVPSDPLFHVQVGPYTTLSDAEAAKKALEEQGFKPYLKK